MEKKFLLVGALLLAGGFSTMNADVIYVTESGSGDGTSWSSAASLEDALSWAAAGDEVFVAKGTYTGSFKLRAAAKVYGNCVGTETDYVYDSRRARNFFEGSRRKTGTLFGRKGIGNLWTGYIWWRCIDGDHRSRSWRWCLY